MKNCLVAMTLLVGACSPSVPVPVDPTQGSDTASAPPEDAASNSALDAAAPSINPTAPAPSIHTAAPDASGPPTDISPANTTATAAPNTEWLAKLAKIERTINKQAASGPTEVAAKTLEVAIASLNTLLAEHADHAGALGLRGLAQLLLADPTSSAFFAKAEPNISDDNADAYAPLRACTGPAEDFTRAASDIAASAPANDATGRLTLALAIATRCLGDKAEATRLAVAEMQRRPREEVAAFLTEIGHVGLFIVKGRVLATGLPAVSADGARFAIFGVSTKERPAAGDRPDLSLQLRQADGTVVAEYALSVDDAPKSELPQRLAVQVEAALQGLSGQAWQTLEPLTPLTDASGDLPRTAAFFRPDGGALIELSDWSLTADLGQGIWRATLPKSARAEPGGPMRDDDGGRCEMLNILNSAHVDLAKRVLLLQVTFYPANDLCLSAVTTHVPVTLPASAGGEGWKAATRGGSPAWFTALATQVPDAGLDLPLDRETRAALERFAALWGPRFPKDSAVRRATRLLAADDKARATTP